MPPSAKFRPRPASACASVALAALGFGVAAALAPAAADPMLIGADVSALATLESHGAVFRADGRPGDALRILRDRGFDCFRFRLFVAPDHRGLVTNDLDYTVALARRVKATGARLMLDVHYSDTWADPGKQFKPAAWAKLPFPELVATVRAYTRDVLERFKQAGAAPDYVQLGNEITNGLLWPDGRVEYRESDDSAAWDRLNQLLTAAYAGLDDAFPAGGRPTAVLHIESPDQPLRALWFCRRATEVGWKFDVIGMSYYPEWHGSLDTLRTTLTTLARTFRKPILVVETAYPWKWDEHWDARKANLAWPVTPDGQRRFLRDVLQVVRDLPDGLGAGVLYWHPESIRVPGLHAWVGGSCALFDEQGNLLPAAGFAGASAP